ncbi:MAG: Flp family type IVb pilin [Hyphomonadaceae bacterium]
MAGKRTFRSFREDRSGATAIEYGLIAALIGVVIVGGIGSLGTATSGSFDNTKSSIEDAQAAQASAD